VSFDGLAVVAMLAALAWIFLTFFHWRFWWSDLTLPKVSGKVDKWPEVVAVIPARNEAEVLGPALNSVADQNYPGRFTVILVNDNSSDDTAKVAAAVKGRATVLVLNAPPLRPGWAGKLGAMNAGVELVDKKFTGADFLWFSDADIYHDPDVLKGLVEAALLDKRDMVSQMVRLHCRDIKTISRNTQGVRLVRVKGGDRIARVAPVADDTFYSKETDED